MIEREHELAQLTDALERAPGFAVVEGESGIGKTRLVREATRAQARAGRRVLVGEAHPVLEPFPLGAVLGALLGVEFPPPGRLSAVTGALRALLPERVGELPEAPPPLDDPAAERHRVMRAVAELLGALGPAVLVLEDLHWTDDRTLDLIAVLGASPPPELSVVLTLRDDEVPAGSPLRRAITSLPRDLVRARLRLRPLSASGVGRLVEGMLGAGPVSEPFAAQLRDETGGNPFVVEESVRLLGERGLLVRRAGGWERPLEHLHVPPAVAESILERLGRLAPQARALVEAAAVLGLAGDERLLGRIAGVAPAALEDGMRARLLTEHDGRVGFQHALARQAVYEALPYPRRRALHLAAARELEALADPALLARVAQHLREGGDEPGWARAAEAAADALSQRGEDRAAFQLLRQLLEAAAARERHGELTVKAAWAGRPHPDIDPARRRLIETALRDPGLARELRGELRLLLGWLLLREAEMAQAGVDEVRAAIADLAGRPDLEARALSTLALDWGQEGTSEDQFRYLEAAREAARRANDPLVDAAVAADAVSLLVERGHPEAWTALEALPPPGPSPQITAQYLRGLVNAAFGAAGLGHHLRALEFARRAGTVQAEHGTDAYAQPARVMAALARWSLGEPVPPPEGAGDPATAVALDLHRGEFQLEQGALREAAETLARAGEDALTRGVPALAARAVAGALRAGETESAPALAETLLAWSRAKDGWVWAAPLLIELPAPRSGSLAAEFRAGIEGRDTPLGEAALAFAAARLDGGAEAFRHAREAAASEPRLAVRAAVCEAEARLAAGEHEAAEKLLRDALDRLEEMGSPWQASQVRAVMRDAGIAVARHRSGRRGYGDELSPRERQVAERVAAGLTAREIGDELFLSPRTVEGHVARAMRKLGVASRREVAGALEREKA